MAGKKRGPKPWPGVANRHRQRAIDRAGEVKMLCQDARRALRDGNLDLVSALVDSVEKSAELIITTLETAPSEPEEDNKE